MIMSNVVLPIHMMWRIVHVYFLSVAYCDYCSYMLMFCCCLLFIYINVLARADAQAVFDTVDSAYSECVHIAALMNHLELVGKRVAVTRDMRAVVVAQELARLKSGLESNPNSMAHVDAVKAFMADRKERDGLQMTGGGIIVSLSSSLQYPVYAVTPDVPYPSVLTMAVVWKPLGARENLTCSVHGHAGSERVPRCDHTRQAKRDGVFTTPDEDSTARRVHVISLDDPSTFSQPHPVEKEMQSFQYRSDSLLRTGASDESDSVKNRVVASASQRWPVFSENSASRDDDDSIALGGE